MTRRSSKTFIILCLLTIFFITSFSPEKDPAHSVSLAAIGGFDRNFANTFNGRVLLNYKPLKGLMLTGIEVPAFIFGSNKTLSEAMSFCSLTTPHRLLFINSPNLSQNLNY